MQMRGAEGAGTGRLQAGSRLLVLWLVRWIARRVFKLDAELALLVAVGSAVCGAAAILSVAALTRAKEQHAGIAVALITVSGTAALLIYPVAFLSGWLPVLDERLYGIFVGAIYELAQVYGASFAVSEGALNAATLVKLSKVLMLLPLLLVLGAWRRRANAALNSRLKNSRRSCGSSVPCDADVPRSADEPTCPSSSVVFALGAFDRFR